MTQAAPSPVGFLTITLHAHLPWVINHGTWPHGMEWLHEAAAETYLPLLRVLTNLERDGIPAQFNINLSPILLEQLAHPLFLAEFPRYIHRKILAAREDELTFTNAGEAHLAETARFWQRFYTSALEDFDAYGQNLAQAFARLQRTGLIDLITGAATHGYLPLLGTDESVRAQIRTAVQSHIRHFGEPPAGIWVPECGYRPAGFWNYPVANADGTTVAGFERIGVEQALAESGLQFFFVDTHLVEDSGRNVSPYAAGPGGNRPINRPPDSPDDDAATRKPHGPQRSLYQPYEVDGPYDKRFPTSVFPRDPRTGVQVWSGDTGYPGDLNYLDFHKKRYPGGHRYWQVSGSRVSMADKLPYWPQRAAERVLAHATHFVELVQDAIHSSSIGANPPILCAPFDAELFGHWWFEGALWLEAVCRALHAANNGIQLSTSRSYLEKYPSTGCIAMREGSWGAGGLNQVWMNHETSWTYTHIYPAERFTREVCTAAEWRDSELTVRVVKQLCRELLLLEASDWQFLITTGAARDYAELRFNTHREQFQSLKQLYQNLNAGLSPTPYDLAQLAAIELRDNIFPDIDPSFWAEGSHALPPALAKRP